MDAPSKKDVRRRKGSKHDRTGCLTCRQRLTSRWVNLVAALSSHRHKKCTENMLSDCSACLRLNLECVRAPRRQLVKSSLATVPRVTKPPFADIYPGWQVSEQHRNETTLRRHAMRYYINILSQLLTVSTTHNSFVSAFVPMAMESETLANALVAYAASHMSISDAAYSPVSIHARSEALSGLAKDLTVGFVEINVATCMILLTSEVCDGNYTTWYTHLVGAKQLLCSGTEQGHTNIAFLKRTSEGQWLLRNFAYHDILGSVTAGQRPVMSTVYLQDIGQVFDTYLGVATPILVHISAISDLAQNQSESVVTVWLECLRIRKALVDWTCPTVTSSAHMSLAHAYRGAAVIYLYRKMLSVREAIDQAKGSVSPEQLLLSTVEDCLQDEVCEALNSVQKVPEGHPAESALLFPLFLAGAEAVKEHQMDIVRRRLSTMYGRRRFANILRAQQALESLWRARQSPRSASNVHPDWRQVVEDQGMGLLLLT